MISSLTNPITKRLRALHERRGRLEQGLYLIEGVRLVEEALDGHERPQTIVLAPELLRATARGRALSARLLHGHDLPTVLEVTPVLLRHVAGTETPAGVIAALPRRPVTDLSVLPQKAGLSVVLDGVQDPGNAGTILRTAAAAGVDAVTALSGSADLYAPKVVRAGMGAHLRLALAVDLTVEALTPWLASRGQILLADARAEESVYGVDLRRPTVLIAGSEAHGATALEALPGLRRVAIPMPGGGESLNVAVATAVILFEALRQRAHSASSR